MHPEGGVVAKECPVAILAVGFLDQVFQAYEAFLLHGIDIAQHAALKAEPGNQKHAYEHKSHSSQKCEVESIFNAYFHRCFQGQRFFNCHTIFMLERASRPLCFWGKSQFLAYFLPFRRIWLIPTPGATAFLQLQVKPLSKEISDASKRV